MVKYLVYKGKKLPVRVSYYALKMLKADTNKPLSQLKEDDYEAYESLLYHSLVQGHKKTNTELSITRDDVEDIMDDCFYEFVRMIPEFFSQMEKDSKNKDPKVIAAGK